MRTAIADDVAVHQRLVRRLRSGCVGLAKREQFSEWNPVEHENLHANCRIFM